MYDPLVGFHVVNGRALLDLTVFEREGPRLGLSIMNLTDLLWQHGVTIIAAEPIGYMMNCARQLVRKGKFKRDAKRRQSPETTNCARFIQHLYGLIGVDAPGLSMALWAFSDRIGHEELRACDLIFTKGRGLTFFDGEDDAIGHVAMVTHRATTIRANRETPSRPWAIDERPLNPSFLVSNKVRGFGRIIPADRKFVVVRFPDHDEGGDDWSGIAYSGELIWKIAGWARSAASAK